jgi:hypothetical protein
MKKSIALYILGALLVLLAAAALLYQPVIRPWHMRFGASEAEVQAALPGDEILVAGAVQATRAIDVHAPASQAWPWLLQLGQGRGGLYSYDFLENLAGCDIHTRDAIDPALQNLRVGDVIRIGKQEGLPYYRVALIEPQRALVLRSVDSKTGKDSDGTWGFYLEEKSAALTRLIIRHRDLPSLDATSKTVNAIFEPISFFMEQRMLRGLRDHAEKLAAN